MRMKNSEGYMDPVPYQAINHAEGRAGYLPLVYICAPFGGDTRTNTRKAADFAAFAYTRGNIPLTPHLLFPFMDDRDPDERRLALRMDIVLMGKCEEVWVLGSRVTPGMEEEIRKAKSRRQRVRYFTDDFMEVRP
ncbi:MAG: DUF4406 domain-containing protein [Candidatus Weimeria sp.]